MKRVNYKVGAIKRKFKLGRSDFSAGTAISLMNEQKQERPKTSAGDSEVEKVAIMGLV